MGAPQAITDTLAATAAPATSRTTLSATTATAAWTVWGLTASVVVTDPMRPGSFVEAAEARVRDVLDDVDLACSRFRQDSELAWLRPTLSRGATVSPMLARLVRAALLAAQWTDGAVDPTLGNDLISLGYDRDFSVIGEGGPAAGTGTPAARRGSLPGWQRISLDGHVLTVPDDLTLDLGATAKAVAADVAAADVAATLGCGVLVCLGGDIATAGQGPAERWQVLVQDTEDDPAQQISLTAGHSLATSSTSKRRWLRDGRQVHHILDPRFGLPAETVWRSASVAAPTCLRANAMSTAAIVRGHAAVPWFTAQTVSARLVDQRRRTIVTGGWPAEAPPGAGSHG